MSRHLRATGRWSGYYSSAVATVQQEGLVWPSGCGKDRKAEMLCFSAGVMPVDHWVVLGIQRIGSGHDTRLFIVSDQTEKDTNQSWLCAKHDNITSGGLSSYASRIFHEAYFKKKS